MYKIIRDEFSNSENTIHKISTNKPNDIILFANGGDRTNTNTPEKKLCEELGIKMLWNVGGGKIQSSSDLVESVSEETTTSPQSAGRHGTAKTDTKGV